jgi:predicted outer membrane protein
MNPLRTHAGKREIIIAAVVISALAGCGTPSNRAPVANTNVTAAPEAAPRAPARPFRTHASSAPAAPKKGNTRTVLSQIHQANLMEIALGKMAEEKASTSEVRAYADQLVQDHTNVDQMVVAMPQKSSAQEHWRPAPGQRTSDWRRVSSLQEFQHPAGRN